MASDLLRVRQELMVSVASEMAQQAKSRQVQAC